MILPTTFLILAQTAPFLTPTHGRPSHPSAFPSPSPEVRITVVNATCSPSISLSVAGTNLPVAYPLFRQGEWTGNAPLKTPEIHYLARNVRGDTVADRIIRFRPLSSQILLLTGDLSTTGPADKLPQVAPAATPGIHPATPNFQFHIYPEEAAPREECRYRVVNAMPSRILILREAGGGGKPPRQLSLLAPGGSALFVRQPSCVEWEAEIDGKTYPLQIRQEGGPRNCLIPFFLRGDTPSFIRVFESR